VILLRCVKMLGGLRRIIMNKIKNHYLKKVWQKYMVSIGTSEYDDFSSKWKFLNNTVKS